MTAHSQSIALNFVRYIRTIVKALRAGAAAAGAAVRVAEVAGGFILSLHIGERSAMITVFGKGRGFRVVRLLEEVRNSVPELSPFAPAM